MKIRYIVAVLFALALFTACGKKATAPQESAPSKEEEKVQVAEKNDSEKPAETFAIFVGVLKEDPTKDGAETLRLHLTEITAENDPDKMIGSFSQDGVILNAQAAEFKGGTLPEDLKGGSKVRFTLKENAIMTMSIPPQIPGNSIQEIEILK